MLEPEEPRPCPYTDCPVSFISEAALKRHIRNVHSSLRDFTCPTCARSCRNAVLLSAHMLKTHGQAMTPMKPEIRVACGQCRVVLKSQEALLSHMQVHKVDAMQAKLAAGISPKKALRPDSTDHTERLKFEESGSEECIELFCFMCSCNVDGELYYAHMRRHAEALSKASRETADMLAKYLRTTEEAGAVFVRKNLGEEQ